MRRIVNQMGYSGEILCFIWWWLRHSENLSRDKTFFSKYVHFPSQLFWHCCQANGNSEDVVIITGGQSCRKESIQHICSRTLIQAMHIHKHRTALHVKCMCTVNDDCSTANETFETVRTESLRARRHHNLKQCQDGEGPHKQLYIKMAPCKLEQAV
jgi:hypothetical protein